MRVFIGKYLCPLSRIPSTEQACASCRTWNIRQCMHALQCNWRVGDFDAENFDN